MRTAQKRRFPWHLIAEKQIKSPIGVPAIKQVRQWELFYYSSNIVLGAEDLAGERLAGDNAVKLFHIHLKRRLFDHLLHIGLGGLQVLP